MFSYKNSKFSWTIMELITSYPSRWARRKEVGESSMRGIDSCTLLVWTKKNNTKENDSCEAMVTNSLFKVSPLSGDVKIMWNVERTLHLSMFNYLSSYQTWLNMWDGLKGTFSL